jgi:hypothetical protein
MAITERYCNPDLATGLNDGTSEANAWQSLSTAASSYAAGHRVNIKRTSSRDASGDVTFATSATALSPVHIRGYTSTIGDGGMYQTSGTLTFSGDVMLVEGIDTERSSSYSQPFIMGSNGGIAYRCRSKNTSATSVCRSMQLFDAGAMYCDIINVSSDSNSSALEISRGFAHGCRVNSNSGRGIDLEHGYRVGDLQKCYIFGNGSAGSSGIYVTGIDNNGGLGYTDNYIYGVADGIYFNDLDAFPIGTHSFVGRNIIYSVTNGIFNNDTGVVESTATLIQNAIGSAATARYSGFGDLPLPGDITLTADPFVDAANGDFTLNNVSGGGALLRAVGFQINMAYDWDNMTDLGTFSPSTETSHTFAC